MDTAKNDREYLNNLMISIFGKKVLETSSITGAPSNRTKGKQVLESSSFTNAFNNDSKAKGKKKLDPDLLQLTYGLHTVSSTTVLKNDDFLLF